jgi:hypothetical protein
MPARPYPSPHPWFLGPVSFEGPVYADRVGGKLTFRDWDHWDKADQDKWRDDPRAPKAK